MAAEIKIPSLGESVTEATIAKWLKNVGDTVAQDEPVVELETDKVTLEVNAPESGTLAEITSEAGATVNVGAIVGKITEGAVKAAQSASKKEEAKPEAKAEPAKRTGTSAESAPAAPQSASAQVSPAAQKWAADNKVDPTQISGTGKHGHVTKGDVINFLDKGGAAQPASKPSIQNAPSPAGEREERVKMTRLRLKIAERLKSAQHEAAILTTFNEIDMSNVIALREKYKPAFEKKHGVKLGFMGFFVQACIHALKEIPAVNAQIDGDEIVYKNHYDIGVAVGTQQGLIVPVVKDADQLSLADIEKTIGDYGARARDNKIKLEELQGGTFTISNGGVYGSLMSTPILNPPQSGILGMHKTEQRAVVVDGQIVIRPMMYIALSYDHRIIDGKEAVTFLVRVKEAIEDPQRLLLGV